MSDRTETHSDFAWPAAETPWAESRSGESTTDKPRPGAPGRHSFIVSANPRDKTCERCGLPRKAHDPELRRTSVVGHLNLAIKAAREDDMHLCAVHVGTARKLLDGDG